MNVIARIANLGILVILLLIAKMQFDDPFSVKTFIFGFAFSMLWMYGVYFPIFRKDFLDE